MARRSKQDADETKKNILAAAIRVFLKKGVSNTSLEDIATAAKVTRGAIYWHFMDKADILNHIIDETMTPIAKITGSIAENREPDSLEELKNHIKNVFRDIFSDKKVYRVFCIFLTKLNYTDDLKGFYKKHRERSKEMTKVMNDFFYNLQQRKIIKSNFQSGVISRSIFCYFMGLLTEHFKNPVESDLEKSYPDYIDLFFSSL